MFFALHRPRAPLADFVEHIIFFSGVSPAHHREKLLPHGAFELIVDLTETPKTLYATETGESGTAYRKAWLSGVQQRFIVIEAAIGASMLIIRFRPGAAFAVFGFAAEALTGHVTTLADIASARAASLRDRLLEAPDAAGKFAGAEAWLRDMIGTRLPNPAATHLATLLHRPMGRIADLADRIGLSDRQLRSLFLRHVGTAPKSYARIRRFQSVIAMTTGNTEPDWRDVAAASGYADQSHLVHEFRHFSGLTPTAFAATYPGLDNYLPITLAR